MSNGITLNAGGNVHVKETNFVQNSYISQAPIEDDVGTSGKIWSLYRIEAEKADNDRIERWREGMDGLLLFAGIFSATVTAFIIEGSRALQRNSGDTTVVLLSQILLQLGNGSQSTSSPPSPSSDLIPFKPSSHVLRMNILWYLSLACALMCALAATLVELWGRIYIQTVRRSSSARISAKMRIFLLDGFRSYRLAAVVSLIPSLMHAAVMLFMAGLTEFMHPINAIIYHLSVAILALTAFLYGLAVLSPIFSVNSPYLAPISPVIWRIFRGKKNMAETRKTLALESLDTAHIRSALRETVDSLADNAAFQPFVDGIPGFFADADELPSHKIAMLQLLFHGRSKVVVRIERLLRSCIGDVTGSTRDKRVVICMSALWSCIQTFSDEAWNRQYYPGLTGLKPHQFNFSLVEEVKESMIGENVDRIYRFATFTLAALKHCLLLHVESFFMINVTADLAKAWAEIKCLAESVWPNSESHPDPICGDIEHFTQDPRTSGRLVKSIIETRIGLLLSVAQEQIEDSSEGQFLSIPAFLHRRWKTIQLLTHSTNLNDVFKGFDEFMEDMTKIWESTSDITSKEISDIVDGRPYR